MIKRDKIIAKIQKTFQTHRIVCLLGPREVGKNTIANVIQKGYSQVHYFDLRTLGAMRALDMPDITLYNLRGLIVINEIQRRPDLFSYLRYLHDRNFDQKFLILGDFERSSIGQSSESLTGRIAYIEVNTFSLEEVNDFENLWLKGGFPQSYSLNQKNSLLWREEYMLSQAERHLAIVGFSYDRIILRKLCFMLAEHSALMINYTKLAYELEVSTPTIIKYVSYLERSFMIRLLNPWSEDLTKRQIKTPKVYYRDSGLLNYALDLKSYEDLQDDPRIKVLFESFAMEEIIKFHAANSNDCYFWASLNRAELSLLIHDRVDKFGFEFSVSEAPKLTRSMRIAMKDLKLNSLTVIYPKGKSYILADNIQVISLEEYLNKV